MKLCKDCKHCVPSKILFFKDYEFAKCKYPSIASMVDGSPLGFCSSIRSINSYCGVDAKYFEAKNAKRN